MSKPGVCLYPEINKDAKTWRGIHRLLCDRKSENHDCIGVATLTSESLTVRCKRCGDAKTLLKTRSQKPMSSSKAKTKYLGTDISFFQAAMPGPGSAMLFVSDASGGRVVIKKIKVNAKKYPYRASYGRRWTDKGHAKGNYPDLLLESAGTLVDTKSIQLVAAAIKKTGNPVPVPNSEQLGFPTHIRSSIV